MVERVVISAPETGPNAPVVETPAAEPWRPEGFTGDQAALAKSWADQRAEITRLQQGAKKTPDEETPPVVTPPTEEKKPDDKPGEEKKPDEKPADGDDAAKKVVDASGFDVAPFSQEFDTTGDVSAENRAKIAEGLKGVLGDNAEQVVNQYIDGQKALRVNDAAMYHEAAGGQENLTAMLTWAKDNLPKEQIAAYNTAVNSRDRHATVFAIEGLKAKFEAKNGKLPSNTLKPGAGVTSNAQAFQSSAQMTEAMKDPRYKTDQAYRDSVAARIAVSNFN